MEMERSGSGPLAEEFREGCAAGGPRAPCSAGAESGPSTVSVVEALAEDGVIRQQQWEAIHARRTAGASVSQIARDLDLDRKTVRAALAKSAWRPYQREVKPPGMLDDHLDWLAARASKVGFSARILHHELVTQRGFTGGYETVKRAVRPLRAQAQVASLTQCRFETAPGEQAQCDWGQVTVCFGDQPVRVHVFVMTLGYSRRGYAEGFEHERMASLLAAHERAFAHFGGRCETLLYDRMRTVVLSDPGRSSRLNSTFDAFARHWGFTPRLCQPYRAQTKGKVESGVKYVKRNFVPGRSFRDMDDFNAQLSAWQAEVADLRIHGTTHQRPIDRFADEVGLLVPVGGQASFLQAMVRERIVAEDWLVSLDANRYSVPFGLIGRTVQVVREGGQWVIRHRGEIVAVHPVLPGRGQLSVRPEHGPGAVARTARQRLGGVDEAVVTTRNEQGHDVEVRDLMIYERLAAASLAEVA